MHRRHFCKTSLTTTGLLALDRSSRAVACSAAAEKLPIGMNLSGISDYEPGFPFVNLLWGARPWLTRLTKGGGPWNTEQAGKMEFDQDGYPLAVPFISSDSSEHDVFTILPNHGKPGKYVLLFDGSGRIGVDFETKILSEKPGRVLLQMSHGASDSKIELLRILESKRGDHIRNMRIMPEDMENANLESSPFLPELLEYCKPFHAIRFMDWLNTNNSVNQTWSARKRRSFFTQQGVAGDVVGLGGNKVSPWERSYGSGVAMELCIQLANATRCDAWVCVPHLADDEYIEQMARMFHRQLDPSLKVVVEYSNEVWNWQFQQAHWNLHSKLLGDRLEKLGIKAWEKKPDFNDLGVAINNAGTNFPERMAMATRRIHSLWEQIFTGKDRERLVRVAAGQAAWQDVSSRCLRTVMQHGGCDAFTVAGYFGPDDKVYSGWEKAGKALTAKQVLQDMHGVIDSEGQKICADVSKLCKENKVDFLVYEGGQHIQPKGQQETPYMPALKNCQTDQGMFDCYRKLLNMHAKSDCKLFMAFASISKQGSRYGSWGHSQSYAEKPTDAPKLRAILEANILKSEQAAK